MRLTHLYGGILMTLVSLFCLLWLIPNHTEQAQSELDLSPAFMPTVAMSTCLLMALLMVLKAWYESRTAAVEAHEEFGEEATGASREVFGNLGLWSVAAFVALALMDSIGFEVAMSTWLLACFLYLRMKRYGLMMALTVVTPMFLSLATWYLFTIQMPGFAEHITPYTDPIMAAIGLLDY